MPHDVGMDEQKRKPNGETGAATLFHQTNGSFLGGLLSSNSFFVFPLPLTRSSAVNARHADKTRPGRYGSPSAPWLFWEQGTAGRFGKGVREQAGGESVGQHHVLDLTARLSRLSFWLLCWSVWMRGTAPGADMLPGVSPLMGPPTRPFPPLFSSPGSLASHPPLSPPQAKLGMQLYRCM